MSWFRSRVSKPGDLYGRALRIPWRFPFLCVRRFLGGKVSVVGVGACPSKWKALWIWLEASGRSGGAVDTETDRQASSSAPKAGSSVFGPKAWPPFFYFYGSAAIARGSPVRRGTRERALD